MYEPALQGGMCLSHRSRSIPTCFQFGASILVERMFCPVRNGGAAQRERYYTDLLKSFSETVLDVLAKNGCLEDFQANLTGFGGTQLELFKLLKQKSHQNVAAVVAEIFSRLIDKDAGDWVRTWIKENPPRFMDEEIENV